MASASETFSVDTTAADSSVQRMGNFLTRYSDWLLGIGVLALMVTLLTPLPPGILDLLLACNITCSLMLLLVTMNVRSSAELSTFPTVRDERDKDDAAIKSPDALKAGAAGSASLVALGGGLPLGSVLAAGGAPSALLTPGMVTFLQTFPPLAAQACFLAPMDTMKKIRADGDVGSLPLLPFAAMAVNGIGWVTYGVLAGLTGPEASIMDPNAMTIWVPNITAFLFGAYYWKV